MTLFNFTQGHQILVKLNEFEMFVTWFSNQIPCPKTLLGFVNHFEIRLFDYLQLYLFNTHIK